METFWKSIIWQQFGAAIDMLENEMRACPDKLWHARLWNDHERPRSSEFWYILYHTLFYLDLYLSGKEEGFAPPAPFTLDEMDPSGRMPSRPFTRDELRSYLEHGRNKCRAAIENLTDEAARQPCGFYWLKMSFAELLLYTLRHVQEHGGQLGLFLGQQGVSVADWVSQAKDER